MRTPNVRSQLLRSRPGGWAHVALILLRARGRRAGRGRPRSHWVHEVGDRDAARRGRHDGEAQAVKTKAEPFVAGDGRQG